MFFHWFFFLDPKKSHFCASKNTWHTEKMRNILYCVVSGLKGCLISSFHHICRHSGVEGTSDKRQTTTVQVSCLRFNYLFF